MIMPKLKLALDWTANINHIGFFVAQEKGFYHEIGLDVEIISPATDDYEMTPAKKVELGLADLALTPTESVISYRTKANPFPMIGIAAIFQKDLSAIVTLEREDIKTPKDLDGKSYASYQARYEDHIVKQMIISDGGVADLSLAYPKKLGIWDTLLSGKYDATWIFSNWEGVDAICESVKLTEFRLEDYDVPYSYSPLIVADERRLLEKPDLFQAFLSASKKGFLFSRNQPEEAVSLLQKYVPSSDENIDLAMALSRSADAFGGEDEWGKMEIPVVEKFISWLKENQLENAHLSTDQIVTNRLLDPLN